MPLYQLRFEQEIPAPPEEVWDFVSSPANLSRITPPSMGFKVISDDLPGKMYAGMIVLYGVSPFPALRLRWVTEITHVEEGRYFVDEQRCGPYAFWHHQHFISPCGRGTSMKDIVSYKPPFGVMGAPLNTFLVRPRLKGIFDFRRRALEEIFGPAGEGSRT